MNCFLFRQVPPLPPKPIVKLHDAETKSRKQLGSSSKVLIADEFYKDCKSLQRLVAIPSFRILLLGMFQNFIVFKPA